MFSLCTIAVHLVFTLLTLCLRWVPEYSTKKGKFVHILFLAFTVNEYSHATTDAFLCENSFMRQDKLLKHSEWVSTSALNHITLHFNNIDQRQFSSLRSHWIRSPYAVFVHLMGEHNSKLLSWEWLAYAYCFSFFYFADSIHLSAYMWLHILETFSGDVTLLKTTKSRPYHIIIGVLKISFKNLCSVDKVLLGTLEQGKPWK